MHLLRDAGYSIIGLGFQGSCYRFKLHVPPSSFGQIQVQTPPQRIMGSSAAASPASPAALATQKMAERLEEKAANIGKPICF